MERQCRNRKLARRCVFRLSNALTAFANTVTAKWRNSSDPFNAEHIIPRSRGGVTALNNLALACFGCNNKKWTHVTGQDSVTQSSAPLYHPRQDRWSDHFEWNATYTLLLGLTPTGRATVDLLALNRQGVVNLRRILYAHGEHPPHPIDD